eukprot:GEMP01062686.1.p1 GENE.GEMP01062686.1~~GEMP01062686.1.p1  ORF type:complete len:339 (+),score=62.78 GEMP01062686.1:167-1183(+)
MRVQCYVYDITNGMARAMSRLLIGKQVDIIPHTGIVFGGKEYFFGGGICASPNPGNCIPLRPCETLELGNTTKTPQELEAWLQTQHQTWSQDTYNLLSHNCNHFANAVAKFLGVTEVPGRIVNIAEEALSTPQGAQIRQLIESFDRQMQQSSGGLNPFGNVQASAPEPVVNTLELEESLKDIAKEPTEVQRACLTTLIKLATNANTHRGEPLYQKVKMENPTFVKKVGGCAGGTEAMLAIGFVPDTHETIDYWVMQPDHHPNLSANIERMEKLLAKLPTAPAPAPAPAPAARAAPAAPAALDMRVTVLVPLNEEYTVKKIGEIVFVFLKCTRSMPARI